MSKETTYPSQLHFAENGPTLKKLLETLLREKKREGTGPWTSQR